MKIQSIDLFYFALPQIHDIADGSQDSFIVRVRSDDGVEGFGESDSSPLVAMACYCAPTSHSNIVNIRSSLIGQTIDSVEDIRRLHRLAGRRALDIAHFPHAYAAVDIALWDMLGKKLARPTYQMLGYRRQQAKRAYGSYLFADTPQATAALATEAQSKGFTAAKFGWGPMGRRGRDFDIDLVRHARQGLGDSTPLMVDAGTVWQSDVDTALDRARAFAAFDLTWLEEPLAPQAIDAYRRLSAATPVPIAAGEGCDTLRAAQDLVENGNVQFLQIDPGRIGGITPAFDALQMATQHGVTFVNHTFKSHISLAAAMAVFAGHDQCPWVEYCGGDSPLVRRIVANPIEPDEQGMVALHEAPGLGVDVQLDAVRQFARQVRIEIDGTIVATTGQVDRVV